MPSYFGTPLAKIIITDAHTPEQENIIEKCLLAGCPVTLYADTLTDDLVIFSKLSYVQVRIGQVNLPIPDPDNTILVTKQLSAMTKQYIYLEHVIG